MCRRRLFVAMSSSILPARTLGHQSPTTTGPLRRAHLNVLVLPAQVTATTLVPKSGTAVVEGANAGNSHVVYAADGPAYCDTAIPHHEDLRIAILTVPAGSRVYLGHAEHGYMGIAPGNYEIRRQREMAAWARMVID
nr:hypothetical protein [Mycobacterium bourgelatii]